MYCNNITPCIFYWRCFGVYFGQKLKFVRYIIIALVALSFCRCDLFRKKISIAGDEDTLLIISVNGMDYYQSDFLNFLHITFPDLSDINLTEKNIREKIVNDFVLFTILLQGATIPDNIDENAYKERLSKIDFDHIKKYETDKEYLKQFIINQHLINEFLDRSVLDEIDVTDSELSDEYNDYLKAFIPVDEKHLYHIVTEDLGAAKKAMKELKEKKSFKNIAKKYSIGPAASKGGDLGFKYMKDTPEFFKCVENLKDGTYSTIITSNYGYHIIKVENTRGMKPLTFDKIRDTLYDRLYIKKRSDLIREKIKEIKENASIIYHGDVDFSHIVQTGLHGSN